MEQAFVIAELARLFGYFGATMKLKVEPAPTGRQLHFLIERKSPPFKMQGGDGGRPVLIPPAALRHTFSVAEKDLIADPVAAVKRVFLVFFESVRRQAGSPYPPEKPRVRLKLADGTDAPLSEEAEDAAD